MSQHALDTFTEAHALGLTDGFVGTYQDLLTLVLEATVVIPDEDGFAAYETYLESNWAGADQYRAEEEADMARTLLSDPIWGAAA